VPLWLCLGLAAAAAASADIVQPTNLLHRATTLPSLEMAPCATFSAPFSLNESGSSLVSLGWPDQCVTAPCHRRLRAGTGAGPVSLAACGASPGCQAWALQPNGTITSGGLCLQSAPRLQLSVCGVGWAQQWALENGTVRQAGGGGCIVATMPAPPLERAPPAPPLVSSALVDVCTGSSSKLAAAECAAWVSLYNETGGATSWTYCGANRLDPCACSYVDAYKNTRGMTCSADGQHILDL
jgi:hypothetical protein